MLLKTFQLRIARSVTSIGVREVALYLRVSRTIVSRWEKQLPLDPIKTKKGSTDSLVFFFKQHNILFPNENTVILDVSITPTHSEHLTRFQLRAARAALGLTQNKLSELTNIPRSIINYLETQQNNKFLNTTNKDVDDIALKNFFESAGLNFPSSLSIYVTQNLQTFD